MKTTIQIEIEDTDPQLSELIGPDEIVCPASDEAGKRRQCASCMACNGGNCGKRSIVIIGHGSPAVLSGVNRVSDN